MCKRSHARLHDGRSPAPDGGRAAAVVLVLACGATLGWLAVLHCLSADRNLRRAAVRAVGGGAVASIALLHLPARAALEATVAILGVQVPAVLSGWSGHRLLFSRSAPWFLFTGAARLHIVDGLDDAWRQCRL